MIEVDSILVKGVMDGSGSAAVTELKDFLDSKGMTLLRVKDMRVSFYQESYGKIFFEAEVELAKPKLKGGKK